MSHLKRISNYGCNFRQSSKSLLNFYLDGTNILETKYDNGRVSPFTKLVILMENPKNTFDICYCYGEQYKGPQSLNNTKQFDYLECNWQMGNRNDKNGSKLVSNLPFFDVDCLNIFKSFNYTYNGLDELSNDCNNNGHNSSILNEPLLIVLMYNEWFNDEIKSLIPEPDQVSSLLSNMGFPMKFTKKTLNECNDICRKALEKLQCDFYYFRQLNRVKFNLGGKVDIAWNGKINTKIPRNLVQSSTKIYDSALNYYKTVNGGDDNDSRMVMVQMVVAQDIHIQNVDFYQVRNKMEKILIFRYSQDCIVEILKSMDNDLKSFSQFLESMIDNIKKLGEENDDSETFKEMFNPSNLDSVTRFLGVLRRSLVDAPETSEFSEHLTSTLKVIAEAQLKKFWNNGVMMKDSGDFLNSCKITGKFYDEWQSAVMRLFSHKRDTRLMKQCCNLILIIGNVLHDSILDVTEINYIKDGNNSSRNALSSKVIHPMIVTWIFDSMFTISNQMKSQFVDLLVFLIQIVQLAPELDEFMHNLNELLQNTKKKSVLQYTNKEFAQDEKSSANSPKTDDKTSSSVGAAPVPLPDPKKNNKNNHLSELPKRAASPKPPDSIISASTKASDTTVGNLGTVTTSTVVAVPDVGGTSRVVASLENNSKNVSVGGSILSYKNEKIDKTIENKKEDGTDKEKIEYDNLIETRSKYVERFEFYRIIAYICVLLNFNDLFKDKILNSSNLAAIQPGSESPLTMCYSISHLLFSRMKYLKLDEVFPTQNQIQVQQIIGYQRRCINDYYHKYSLFGQFMNKYGINDIVVVILQECIIQCFVVKIAWMQVDHIVNHGQQCVVKSTMETIYHYG